MQIYLPPQAIFRIADEKETGVEYLRTIMYYLARATGRVSRAELEQALLAQGAPGEKLMATIADEYIQIGYEKGA